MARRTFISSPVEPDEGERWLRAATGRPTDDTPAPEANEGQEAAVRAALRGEDGPPPEPSPKRPIPMAPGGVRTQVVGIGSTDDWLRRLVEDVHRLPGGWVEHHST